MYRVPGVRWSVCRGSRHARVYPAQPGHGRDSTDCLSYSERFPIRFHRSPQDAQFTIQLSTTHRPYSDPLPRVDANSRPP